MAGASMAGVSIEDRFVAVPDGLKLHLRDWRPEAPRGWPVVCLPGLARTLEDFVDIAERLSADGRRVVALSARGRGRSDRDPDPSRYQLKIEAEDALDALDALGIERGHVIGTSRGGLQAMMIGALRPRILGSTVLNDIGPVVELDGLRRINEALSRATIPESYADGARRIARFNGERFPALEAEDWDRWARRSWIETPEGLAPTCDPALLGIFKDIDLDAPSPPVWPLFDALAGAPLMVVRGELSDLLSVETVIAMAGRRPTTVFTTPGQGHAPLLDDAPTMEAIARFLDGAEASSG